MYNVVGSRFVPKRRCTEISHSILQKFHKLQKIISKIWQESFYSGMVDCLRVDTMHGSSKAEKSHKKVPGLKPRFSSFRNALAGNLVVWAF